MAREPSSTFPLSEQRMRNNSNRRSSTSPVNNSSSNSSPTHSGTNPQLYAPRKSSPIPVTPTGTLATSSAVQTLNPNSMAMVNNGVSKPAKNEKLCRNVLIYGSCRFEDKGCVYSHGNLQGPSTKGSASPTGTSNFSSGRPRGPLTSAAFGPSASAQPFNPSSSGRPIPASFSTAASVSDSSPMTSPSRMSASVSAPVFKPAGTSPLASTSELATRANAIGGSISSEHLKAATFVPRSGAGVTAGPVQPTIYQAPDEELPIGVRGEVGGYVSGSMMNMNGAAPGGTSSQAMNIEQKDYYPTDTRALDHHLYTTPLPHTANLPASHLPLHNFFLPADLLAFIHGRAEAKLASRSADGSLPTELHVYHSLHTLMAEATPQERSMRVFGYITDAYRARCRLDGRLYCLRRVEGFKLGKETAFSVLDKWRRIRHPNIVSVREAFTTRLFNDSSVIFAYDYHPRSRTLYEAHLGNQIEMVTQPNGTITPAPKAPTGIPERVLWSYIAQTANGLKAIHTAGLACRTIEPTKIILTGRNRIRLNCCSIFDVTTFDSPSANLHYQQQDDLLNFGKLLVSLCCGTTGAVHALAASLEAIQGAYSPDVKLVILYLLGKPGPGKSIDDILVMLGPRLLNEFDAMQNYADSLESGLEAEVENGRVARMLIKLGFINERPEFQQDPRWSETGDRYVLKLFRDYVFHSVDEMGHPVLDLTHVLLALNKTDASLDEKIMLVARDEQSCLVVSYREIRNSIEQTYMELMQQSAGMR